jgi:hypothetical protein
LVLFSLLTVPGDSTITFHLGSAAVLSITILTMEAGQFEVIGGEKNFWLYSKTGGFDLTHPRTPTSPRIYPRIQIETTTGYVAIDPSKTALVVVDLQNYFLSPSLGRPTSGVGMKVVDQLLKVDSSLQEGRHTDLVA